MTTAADGPLTGLGVVVTRDEGPDGPLASALRARGARVVFWTVTTSAPPLDDAPLDEALRRLDRFQWLVLTSRRAVDAVADRCAAVPPGVRVAAVGAGTAEAARSRGMAIDLVPATRTAEALVAELSAAGAGAGSRVLFPASEIARDTLERGLADLGTEVVRVTAYRTLPVAVDGGACRHALDAGTVQVVTFTSPSALDALRAGLDEALFRRVASELALAAIGPTTAGAIRSAGCEAVIEAAEHSFDGLADAIAAWAMHRARGAG